MDIMKKSYGVDLFGESMAPVASGRLCEKFLIPPFSVLDSKQGYWQDRKRAWKSLGIKSECGRQAQSYNTTKWLRDKNNFGKEVGESFDTGTSIFDPVLCEIFYKWLCPQSGQIIDPFAGGSVRGIVAGFLGFKYWGCDLSEVQIKANIKQREQIKTAEKPFWVCGDSSETIKDAPEADLIFSCPPYGNLEKYSDKKEDLSNMDLEEFLTAYADIIKKSIQKLKQNRFAVFVVGDYRGKDGFYVNFPGKTVEAFEKARARLYNESILLNVSGTAAFRASKQFDNSRKFVKIHQNVLVFCKGDPKKATAEINDEI